MTNIILQPCGDSDANKHFVDTILNPISVDRINSHLSPEQKKILEPIFRGRESIAVWGVTPGKNNVNEKKWGKIQAGDIALFSREGKIFASSTVAEKIHNKDLALDLWQENSSGMTWEYVYFLDELIHQDITYLTFNKAIGYADNFVIQGFNVVDPEKSARTIEALDLFSERYIPEVNSDDFQSAVELSISMATTDAEVKSKARLEQSYLRKYLFGKRVISNCSICLQEYPVDMLCASHIKKRSKCSHEERLDYKHIVVSMCVNGCDALFEKGYIVIDEKGVINKGRTDVSTDGLSNKIESLTGKVCSGWNLQNEKYFKWHRAKYYKE